MSDEKKQVWAATFERPRTKSRVEIPVRKFDEFTDTLQQMHEAVFLAMSMQRGGFEFAKIQLSDTYSDSLV